MAVKKGDKVRIDYSISLTDGTVLEKTEDGESLDIEVGASEILEGVDKAVEGMEEGGEKTVTIDPENAFGIINHDLVIEIPMERFPEGMALKKGSTFELELPSGDKAPATVIDVTVDGVTIDLNHPLSGQSLKVWVRVVDIIESKE